MLEELIFWIRTKFDGIDQGSKAAVNTLQQTGQAYKDTQAKVQTSAQAISKSLSDTSAQVVSSGQRITNQYNNMSFDRLYNEFFKIEDKIKQQIQVLNDAEAEVKEYQAIWDQVAASGTRTASTAAADPQLQALRQSADEARVSLQALQAQQQQVTSAMVNSSQAQAVKQQFAQTKVGIDSVANSLYLVSYAAGGSVSQFAHLIQQIRFLKEGFTATAKTAGTMTAAFTTSLGAIGIAATAVMLIINAITQAEEEARKKAEELREEIKALSDNRIGAAALVSEFENLSNKAVKSADDTKRMLDIRAELVETYGFSVAAVDEEGRLLAGNTELMKEQLKISREMLLTKLQADKAGQEKDYNDALKEQLDLQKKIITTRYSIDFAQRQMANFPVASGGWDYSDEIAQLNNDLKSIKDQLNGAQKKGKDAIDALFKTMILEAQIQGKEVPGAIQQAIKEAMGSAFLQGQDIEDVKPFAQNIFDAYFAFDEDVAESSIAAIQELRDRLIAALVSGGEINLNDEQGMASAKGMIEGILNAAMGDETMQAAYERAAALKRRIYEGLASPEEMAEYDKLITDIDTRLQETRDNATWRPAVDALDDLRKQTVITSKELIKLAVAEEAANKGIKDAASDLRSVASGYDTISKSIKEVADMRAAVKAIEDYNSAAVKSKVMTQNYANAKAWLAEKYGVEKDAIDGMLPSIQDDIALKETLVLADYAVAQASATMALAQMEAMAEMDEDFADKGANIIESLKKIIDKMTELGASSISVDGETIKASGNIPTPKVTRSSGSSKNKALERELSLIEHKAALDKLTTAEEIANLERALKKYAKTTAEKRDLIEQIYALKRQKEQEDLAYQQAMDQLTLREEIAALDKMIASYKAGTDARRELEQRRYEAARQLEQQEYDLKVYYGQLTLREQEAALKKLISTYKEGVQARIDLEKQLYDVQQQIRGANIEQLDRLTDGIISALKARYEEQQRIEEERIRGSIDAWQEWGDVQKAALQAQIDALNDLTEEEDRAEEERKKRRRIAALEQQLQYTQDAYNRRKLQEQLAQAQDDLNKWLVRNERADQIEALQDDMAAVDERVKTEQDALNELLEANNAYYEELMKQQNLQAEAQKVLMNSNQQDIINLLASFAPEYNATGQSLGEQLVDGFMSKVGNIEAWFKSFISSITQSISQRMQNLGSIANMAADQFYANRNIISGPQAAPATGAIQLQPISLEVHYHEPVRNEIEHRRQLEQLIKDITGLG